MTVNRNNRIILKPSIIDKKLRLSSNKTSCIYKSCKIWNVFAKDFFEKNKINSSMIGYIIPGEEANLDLSASIAFIKVHQKKSFDYSSVVDWLTRNKWENMQFEI